MTNFDEVLQAETSREPYRFTLAGREWELPHLADLTLRQQRRFDCFEEEAVVREVAGDELADLLLDTPATVMAQIHVEWLAHAGHKPGESEASSS